MLVHICCSVDSHYFLRKLRETTDEPLIGYFYDPNIHPYSEFLLRYEDVKQSCKELGIELYLGEYDFASWLSGAKGLENEPEKGKRCEFCFDFRMRSTAVFAKKMNEKKITTTLLMSPKKSHSQLTCSLEKICKDENLEFIAPDFRKNGGTNEQFSLAKKDKLYHQNFCGCLYALSKQRENSHTYELMNSIDKQILPNSIEEKLKFYKKVHKLKNKGIKFEILRDKFMNYRLLSGLVKFDGVAVKSYIFHNSHFKRKYNKFNLENSQNSAFVDRDEIKFITINFFNQLANKNYKNMDEILKNPPSLKCQEKVREKIAFKGGFSPIILVEKIPQCRVEILANSDLYLDVREILVKLG